MKEVSIQSLEALVREPEGLRSSAISRRKVANLAAFQTPNSAYLKVCWVTCTLAAAVWSSACERKAPGPEECQRVAMRVVGVNDARLLRAPRVKQAVDEVMVECLTQPYDKKLVQCLEELSHPRACYSDFARRKLGEASE